MSEGELPVLVLAASGWVVLGAAATKEAVKEVVREHFAGAASRAILVWRRTLIQRETAGGPDGYCFQIQ